MTRVLVIDDEPQILRALRINLSVRGYDVSVAATGAEALKSAAEHKPDVVILDLGLPDMSGIDVLAGLRGWLTAPVIVLSARTDSMDKVEALDAGADDYVTKPFSVRELLLRIKAILRRRAADPGVTAEEAHFERLRVDLEGHQVWIDTTALKGGDLWVRAIAEGIINSYAFLVVVSRKALQSQYVQDEITWAKTRNKRILVALLTALGLVWALRRSWPQGTHALVRPWQQLGQMSYSVFLLHFSVCLLVNAVVSHLWPTSPVLNAFGMLLAFALSLAAGRLLYLRVERHVPSWSTALRWQLGLVGAGMLVVITSNWA